ncbi:RHS repeat-associated core domain protein [Bernardetia litoralis DSM 6794]|uniref:RHS repeat-associated core domain protein n=3 Tax=Bernardetia litoralis TaxID=999 RepID=I4AFB3_BERLS|nr:RHS repeat-associated core domain-containing protein [Bernardetia litoralis]AFM02648.1 RHS repeat-associated core domain protein [Bernardetia litoralis DSM 6794]
MIVEKREKITISATSSWQKLVSELTIEQDGNLTVFIDNQDTEAVYFDNLELRIESDSTLVITQEHHYYPFGMNMSGIERDGELKYQFNGMVEKEEAFGLELYETPFRSYDAQLGRFWQVEPLADEYHGVSMYQFGYNNPISHNDPTGLYSIREAWRSIRWGIKSFVDKLGGGDGKVSINTTDWQGNRGHNTWTSAMNTNKLDRETKGQAHQQAKEFFNEGRGTSLSGTQINKLILLEGYYNNKMSSASNPAERNRAMNQIGKFMRKLTRKGYTQGVAEQGIERSETTDLKRTKKLVSVTGGRIVNYDSKWQRMSGAWWIDDTNTSQTDARRIFSINGTGAATTYQLNTNLLILSSQITIQGTGAVGTTNDGNFTNSIDEDAVIIRGSTYNLIGSQPSPSPLDIPSNSPLSVENLNGGFQTSSSMQQTSTFFVGNNTFSWQVSGYQKIQFNFLD